MQLAILYYYCEGPVRDMSDTDVL